MNELPPKAVPVPARSGLALASLILGILSLTCFGFLTGIPAIVCSHKASARIRRSAGQLQGAGLATAGLVTGYLGTALSLILVAVLAVVLAPKIAQARSSAKRQACAANMRQIEGAKDLWAMDHQKTHTDTPSWNDLVGSDKLMKIPPQCPAGGVYTIGNMDTKPACSVPGHKITYFGNR